MTDRPIIFSAPMVRAILDGRKTQTRRILKPQPVCFQDPPGFSWGKYDGLWPDDWFGYGNEIDGALPYGIGDLLWVRETWVHGLSEMGQKPVYYRADGESDTTKWRSPIHMPRSLSRITLEVTDVRVQRLQEISEADAEAEGVDAVSLADVPRQAAWSRRQDFAALWAIIHGPGSWESNPWVVAVSFRRLDA